MELKKLAIPLLLMSVTAPTFAVTNIEFVREESTGKDFYSEFLAKLSGESGNQESNTVHTSLSMAWDDNGSHFMTVFDHVWSNDDGKVDKNQSFLHMRYTKSFDEATGNNMEIYLQGERDKFRDIESRALLGIGYRKTLFNEYNKRFNAFGIGGFFESEEGYGDSAEVDSKLWRMNAYWHHKQPINEKLSVDNVLYYQPALKDISDYRIHNELRLTSEITESATFGFSLTYSYNSDALGDTKKYDTTYGTFFKYRF